MSLAPYDDDQFAAHSAGELPRATPLGERTWTLVLPLPVAPPPYTLVYVLEDARCDVHLVDTGWDLPGSLDLLAHGLEAVGLSLHRVASVTATHLHSDHLGLASAIRSASGARVQVHEAEQIALDTTLRHEAADLDSWGVPPELHDAMAAMIGRARPTEVTADRLLVHDEVLDIPGRQVRVLHTPGHTSGSLCLVEGDTVFTGDLVLPTIFPGVGLGGPADDPLGDYLDSLNLVEALGDPLVAPGHGYVFRGLGERVASIRAHQLGRTAEVTAILERDPEATVWEVASRVTWTAGWGELRGFHRVSALSQTAMRMRYTRHTAESGHTAETGRSTS